MQTKDQIYDKEEKMMEQIRGFIPSIVVIRLQAMNLLKELKESEVIFDVASEELEDAIEGLSRAETALGRSHNHLLVAHTEISTGR